MRAVLQRVAEATVTVDGEVVGAIGAGILALVGVSHQDRPADAKALADKLSVLRIFRDDAGAMNLSVVDIGGSVLIVSQFTLYADLRRGRRPSFGGAAGHGHAEPLVDTVVEHLRDNEVEVSTGRFGATMEVRLVNDGPVTLFLETRDGVVV